MKVDRHKKILAKVPRLDKRRIDRSITVITMRMWYYCSVRSQGDLKFSEGLRVAKGLLKCRCSLVQPWS